MKRILLLIPIIGILFLGACGAAEVPLTHYVSEEFHYSIDYPEDWLTTDLTPTEIGIKPADADYKQIQIKADVGEPLTAAMSIQQQSEMYAANIRQSFAILGATDVSIPENKAGTGRWNWELTFTMTYENTPLEGGEFILETESITYTIFYIQSEDWPEGMEVIDSFSLTQ
jgi:hypothetical protein